jgi:hypothetical protein
MGKMPKLFLNNSVPGMLNNEWQLESLVFFFLIFYPVKVYGSFRMSLAYVHILIYVHIYAHMPAPMHTNAYIHKHRTRTVCKVHRTQMSWPRH